MPRHVEVSLPIHSTDLDDTEQLGLMLALSPKKAALALDCGITRIYELINSGELDSYLDGHARRITVESLRRYQASRLAASRSGAGPTKLREKIAAAETARLAKVRARRMQCARQTAPVRGAGSSA
jgi:hypothetical protein